MTTNLVAAIYCAVGFVLGLLLSPFVGRSLIALFEWRERRRLRRRGVSLVRWPMPQ